MSTKRSATTSTSMLPFDLPESLAINAARMDHLASLGLPLDGRTVLEPGAGVGRLTGFWEERKCLVTSLDLLQGNVTENLARHPGRKNVLWRGVEGGFEDLGRFEIVFCYGLLYHVRDPLKCLTDMATVCDDLLLLETMVHPIDDGQLHLYPQSAGADQGLPGEAYRPSRNWLMEKLTGLFPFTYVSRQQPNYPDFCLSWPGAAGVCRSIFVASRRSFQLPGLLSELPSSQERFSK